MFDLLVHNVTGEVFLFLCAPPITLLNCLLLSPLLIAKESLILVVPGTISASL